MRQSKHWEFKSLSPDLLILPSRLAPLAREVGSCGTLILNPGPLTRGLAGGTYAEATIHPIKESDLRDAILQQQQQRFQQDVAAASESTVVSTVLPSADAYPHRVASRTYVNIVKI